jgi:hypothetical protein
MMQLQKNESNPGASNKRASSCSGKTISSKNLSKGSHPKSREGPLDPKIL